MLAASAIVSASARRPASTRCRRERSSSRRSRTFCSFIAAPFVDRRVPLRCSSPRISVDRGARSRGSRCLVNPSGSLLTYPAGRRLIASPWAPGPPRPLALRSGPATRAPRLEGEPRAQPVFTGRRRRWRSEEHTSELQSHHDLVCRLLLEKKKKMIADEERQAQIIQKNK